MNIKKLPTGFIVQFSSAVCVVAVYCFSIEKHQQRTNKIQKFILNILHLNQYDHCREQSSNILSTVHERV